MSWPLKVAAERKICDRILIGLFTSKAMHYCTHQFNDFALATQHLTDEELGIYVRLRDRYLSSEMPLQCEWIAMAMRTHCEQAVNNVLSFMFKKGDGYWFSEELDEMIAAYQEKAEKASKSAKARWNKSDRKANANQTECERNANAMRTHSECNADAMLTKNLELKTYTDIEKKEIKKKESLVKPEGVSEKVFGEWVNHKKKVSKAPLSQRMIDAVVREAGNAGLTTEQAMVIQLENGWTGFKADYVKDNKRNGSTYQRPAFMPRDPEPDWNSIDYGQSCKIKDL